MPTIYSFLKGFQQVRRSHDGIVFALALVARLVVQVSGRYYLFYVRLHYHFAK